MSAALDVRSCRISATLDGTLCRISAALDVTLCIVHLLNVQRILGTFIMFNKPCSGKWNICIGKMLWHLTVLWIKQSFALLKRPFSFLRENRSISGAIIYEKIPCFCLDSATLRSPFLRSIKKGVIRRIFAESSLNLLLNEPFLTKNAILENTKSFGKRWSPSIYRNKTLVGDFRQNLECYVIA